MSRLIGMVFIAHMHDRAVNKHEGASLALHLCTAAINIILRGGRRAKLGSGVVRRSHKSPLYLAQCTFVRAGVGIQAPILHRGVIHSKPQSDTRGGLSVEKGGVLMNIHFPANFGLFEYVHALKAHWLLHSKLAQSLAKSRFVRKIFKHWVQIMQSMSHFVDRVLLILHQLSIFCEGLLLPKKANLISTRQEVLVSLSLLLTCGEDRAVVASELLRYETHHLVAKCQCLFFAVKTGVYKEAIAMKGLNLLGREWSVHAGAVVLFVHLV
mmetsp:Transcript_29161/g.75043  ORF Transcript_29161/g.75043 Transcript_29161/m.75043 type:complete len:268 (-) Transcript_29161:31-834(-)